VSVDVGRTRIGVILSLGIPARLVFTVAVLARSG
jgi:hypothetical protein